MPGSSFHLPWFTVGASGTLCSPSGDFQLSGYVPLSPVGIGSVGGFGLIGGFWSSECDFRLAGTERQEVIVSSFEPGAFKLYPNSPNPFRQSTEIAYDIPARSRVSLAVFDLGGRQVRLLESGWQDRGRYTVRWDGRDGRGRKCPSGIYFCSVKADDHSAVRKVLIAD